MVVGVDGLFLTLTAPSWVEHTIGGSGRRCRCTGSRGAARLAPSRDLDEWNASAGRRWNEMCKALRRDLGVDVEYFKAAEVQRRGALHFHVLLRDPAGRPLRLSVRRARELAIRYGFGHAVDVQPMAAGHARYVAKYVSKAANDRQDVPWRGWARTERVDKTTGEVRTGRQRVYRATYRTWSCSRAWGRSMASVRASQAHHEVCLERLPSWGRYEPQRAWVHDAGTLGVPDRPPGG